MARKPTGKPTGRPKKEIDKNQFENLCALHCTKEEIADFFFCDADTLNAWCNRTYGDNFSAVYKKHCSRGNISLRRSQMEIAKHNATMAIFLGKQYLGQKDDVDKVGVFDGAEITLRIEDVSGEDNETN